MLLIQQTSTNPYFNIATEEYLLKNSTDDFFILYRNEPSIIVGKHQNTIAEINLQFVKQKGLIVVRRLSGGGTVYHDLGNLNYSFITTGTEGNLVNFKKHTQPIIDILQNLGVDARIGGKNDMRVGDKKISGNAEHVFKNRVLHHGTLLFNSNLDNLNEAIQINPNTYTDKAVKSIRSHVANISDYLNDSLTIEEFAQNTINHIKNTFPNSHEHKFTDNEINSINKLIKTKYSTWEWNYGYSPTYTLNKKLKFNDKILNIQAVVDKSIISQISFEGDFLNKSKVGEIEQLLKDCPHDVDEISKRLSTLDLKKYFPEISLKILLEGLF
jgi:lipoate---protein ligase